MTGQAIKIRNKKQAVKGLNGQMDSDAGGAGCLWAASGAPACRLSATVLGHRGPGCRSDGDRRAGQNGGSMSAIQSGPPLPGREEGDRAGRMRAPRAGGPPAARARLPDSSLGRPGDLPVIEYEFQDVASGFLPRTRQDAARADRRHHQAEHRTRPPHRRSTQPGRRGAAGTGRQRPDLLAQHAGITLGLAEADPRPDPRPQPDDCRPVRPADVP